MQQPAIQLDGQSNITSNGILDRTGGGKSARNDKQLPPISLEIEFVDLKRERIKIIFVV